MIDLYNREHQEAFRLADAALTVAACGNIFSKEATKAAGEYLAREASRSRDDGHERKVLLAMAEYFLANSKMDENGIVRE